MEAQSAGWFMEVLQPAGRATGREFVRFSHLVVRAGFNPPVHDARPVDALAIALPVSSAFASWRLCALAFIANAFLTQRRKDVETAARR